MRSVLTRIRSFAAIVDTTFSLSSPPSLSRSTQVAQRMAKRCWSCAYEKMYGPPLQGLLWKGEARESAGFSKSISCAALGLVHLTLVPKIEPPRRGVPEEECRPCN